jgi:mRNA-degrading endonuclease RelE of RelBE toxin-antitoxin system
MNIELGNPCHEKRSFCPNCTSEFVKVRPSVEAVIVLRHFIKDLKDEKEAESIINEVLDCSNLEFTELHKFEENIDGNLLFRARKDDIHIVYCVDKSRKIVFLRAIRNFIEYKKFLENKKEIKRIIERVR